MKLRGPNNQKIFPKKNCNYISRNLTNIAEVSELKIGREFCKSI